MGRRKGLYSAVLRERRVELVRGHGAEHASQWAAIVSVSAKIGCSARILHNRGGAGGARVAALVLVYRLTNANG